MEENERPFACTTDGCRMRFTNEDHLTVHKKKHDMILNLGNGQKSNAFVADQTPTPTRFIRNCEEVGLFQDLQINPFDDTFRKAVEAGKSGNHLHYADSLAVPPAADDTLHTPHVFPFPHGNEEQHSYKPASAAPLHPLKKETTSSCNNNNLLRGGSSDSSASAATIESICATVKPARTKTRRTVSHTSNAASTAAAFITNTTPVSVSRLPVLKPAASEAAGVVKKETVSVAGQSMQLLVIGLMPDGKLVQLIQDNNSAKPGSAANVTTIPSPENGLTIAKMKLKQTLTNNSRLSAAARSEPPDLSRVTEVPPPAAPAERPVPATAPSPSFRPRRESGSGDDDDGRKNKFRERNRAAAKRCREKRQTWVQDLEKRAEVMHSTNLQLQGEVTSLRAEVAQLKTLLLAHKNCPITQAMNNSQTINISCLPLSTLQTCLLPTTQPSRIVYQPTASTSAQQQSTTDNIAADRQTSSPTNPPKRKRHKSNNDFVTDKSVGDNPTPNVGLVLNGRNLETLSGGVVASSSNPKAESDDDQHELAVPSNSQALYMNFNHLLSLSACATNENNVNMERFKSATVMERFEEEDNVVAVDVMGRINGGSSDSLALEGGSESKVIKLNPNAVRFRIAEDIIKRDQSMGGGAGGGDANNSDSDCEVITGDC